ncbi:bifunctional phosphopantothenoylcysteine decarboxylase/phosphopantothenate--cysteine ligase CoaBC [Candidatus Puniceispirillum sp.]|uniref:bifunctional phosphopantothenoylcysteine decarboxylase/phosphopantothenate--cysteine ligase CoaBC n=1 Tax=Candidatus Puniceispirillum sp. TaxID=2026719 RepID=UPI002FCE1D38
MDVQKVIGQLGGRHALQSLLGVGPSAISNYITRGCFPRRVQSIIDTALQDTPHHNQLHNPNANSTSSTTLTPPRIIHPTHGKRIALIIGGGIAAYKALELTRRLQDHGFHITGIMTKSAQQFITPLSLSALSGEKVYTDLFSLTDEAEMGHIRLARETDLVLVVPATANLMARAANGIADDLASTILLATTAPVMMAPAMNPAMWSHPATQDNLARLQSRGVHIIGPDSGDTACGEDGEGRLTSPQDIVAHVRARLEPDRSSLALSGKHALVTSGPTIEPIDSVRFIANHSSGKQGHAIAAALASHGATVTLVNGPVTIDPPTGVKLVSVETAQEMHDACMAALPADIAVCAAAVADWRAQAPKNHKIKKQAADSMTLNLVKNPDILAALGTHEQRPTLLVGFAAETENLETNAQQKRIAKNCDWIIGNLVAVSSGTNTSDNLVFGHDKNTIMLVRDGTSEAWPKMRKTEIADKLVAAMIMTLNETVADKEPANV